MRAPQLISSRTAFAGRLLRLVESTYRREDGATVEREVVEHPGSAAVVAYDDRHLHLVRQPREATGEAALLEIVAGTRDVEGESALQCAERELGEELGLTARTWEPLGFVYVSPGYCSERIDLFAATGLFERETAADDDESISAERVPLDQLGDLIATVADAKTAVALARLDRLLGAARRER